jgi:hypothetical protein
MSFATLGHWSMQAGPLDRTLVSLSQGSESASGLGSKGVPQNRVTRSFSVTDDFVSQSVIK